MTPREKFTEFRARLSQSLIERDDEVGLTMIGLLTGENVFLYGAPGTAKSVLADMVVQWIGGTKFSVLMSKFTTQEEVFGPLDVQAMRDGRYYRLTDGMFPEATVAFMDELFKSSSAIINTLLKVLNEKRYKNDNKVVQCPLRCCIAAGNETPNSHDGGKELAAAFDRFLLRKSVAPVVTEAGLDRLLWDKIDTTVTERISDLELDQAGLEVAAVPWSKTAKECYKKILQELAHEGVVPGDRRRRHSVGACKANAWLDGATEVESDHLDILAHTLWVDPEDQPRMVRKIVAKLANPASLVVAGLLEEVAEVVNAADPKDFEKSVVSLKKLGEVQDRLKSMQGVKASDALAYVTSQRVKISEIWAK